MICFDKFIDVNLQIYIIIIFLIHFNFYKLFINVYWFPPVHLSFYCPFSYIINVGILVTYNESAISLTLIILICRLPYQYSHYKNLCEDVIKIINEIVVL